MRISQIDYSAIMSANQAKASANSSVSQARNVQFSNQQVERYSENTQRRIDNQRTASIASHVVNTLNSVTKAYESIMKIKENSDTEEANNYLSDITAEYQRMVDSHVNSNTSGFFDEEGRPQISPDIVEWQNSKLAEIDSMGWSDSVKKQARASLESGFRSTENSIYSSLEKRLYQADESAFSEGLTMAADEDAALGGYEIGFSRIDARSASGMYAPAEIAQMKSDYQSLVDGKRNRNEVITKARTDINDALSYIGSLDLKDEKERNSLYQLAYTTDALAEKNLSQQFRQFTQEQLSSGVQPASLWEMVDEQTEGLDQDKQNTVKAAVKAEQYTWALSQLEYPDDLSTISDADLGTLKYSMDTAGDSLFINIESMKAPLVAKIDKEIETRGKTLQQLRSEEAKQIKMQTEVIKSDFLSGKITASQAIQRAGALSSIDGTDDDEKYKQQLIDSVMKEVKSQYSYLIDDSKYSYFKKFMEDASVMLVSDMKMEKGSHEYLDAMRSISEQYQAGMLDLFSDILTGKDITKESIDERLDSLYEVLIKNTIDTYEGLSKSTKSLIASGQYEITDKEQLSRMVQNMDSSRVIEKIGSSYVFASDDAKSIHDYLLTHIQAGLNEMGIAGGTVFFGHKADSKGFETGIPTIRIDNSNGSTTYSMSTDGEIEIVSTDFSSTVPRQQDKSILEGNSGSPDIDSLNQEKAYLRSPKKFIYDDQIASSVKSTLKANLEMLGVISPTDSVSYSFIQKDGKDYVALEANGIRYIMSDGIVQKSVIDREKSEAHREMSSLLSEYSDVLW